MLAGILPKSSSKAVSGFTWPTSQQDLSGKAEKLSRPNLGEKITEVDWAFKNEKMKAEECNEDEAAWSTLIGRGLPMICSDWMDLGVTDASSLMP